MATQISALLAKTILLPIGFEDEAEDYILTKDEEMTLLENEVSMLEKYYGWKLYDKGVSSQAEILAKMGVIDLVEKINVVEILERANSVKHHRIWEQGQREKEKNDEIKKAKELKETWNANKVYNQIKWASATHFGKSLVVNPDTMQIIKPLCYFLSEDQRFETELGYSLSKGIIFRGISGLGKTHIVQCASRNERHPIHVVSMLEIASEVKAEGEYNLPQGFSKYYLDDVGSEEHIQNHYGTKINWFKNFIETFYLRNQQYQRLIFSTNNTAKEIEDKYGFRVRSRLREMFNIIDVTGKDLRE